MSANPFEAAGRAVKVQKLSVIIDRAFDALNIALPEERSAFDAAIAESIAGALKSAGSR